MAPRKGAPRKDSPKKSQNAPGQRRGSPDLNEDEVDDDADLEEGNTRLSDLLKTIKQLSGNWWEVDLTKILDEYIDIISRIEISIDGGATTIDFSKASYVIQNMANAYSKKVDLLLELVEKIREDLRVYTTGDNQPGERNQEGRLKRNRKNPQRLGFQPEDFDLDFLREAGRETSKNVRRVDPQEARQNARSFPFVTLPPWYLTNQNNNTVSDGEAPGANKTPLQSANGDMLGYIEDFRVNRPFESTSGFVGYNFPEEGEQINAIEFNPLVLPTQEPVSQPDPLPLEPGPEVDIAPLPDLPESYDELPEPPDFGGDSGGEEEPGPLQPVERTLTTRDANAGRAEQRKRLPPPILIKPKLDPWTRSDLYEGDTEQKPVKPGKTTLLPDGLKSKKEKKHSLSSTMNGVHSKVQCYIKKLFVSKRNQTLSAKLQKIAVPEFTGESLCNILEVEQLFKKLRKQTANSLRVADSAEDEEMVNNEEDDFDDMHHDLPGNDSFSQDDLAPGPDILPDHGVDIFQTSRLNSTLKEEEAISYENLVQQRVAEYMAQAQEYLQRTDLAKRVAEWHEAVLPRLEESEKQRHFDIHEYGTMVLSRLTENLNKEFCPFGEVVRGKSGAEVARFFSATLQLANSMNVELQDDGALAIDTLRVKFLSSERHHENMDGGEAFQHQKKKGKRKING